jgi:hypothetical protein
MQRASSISLQLKKNYDRKSADGLSPGMFTLTIMANLTYGTSLLLRPLSVQYFVSKLSWLVQNPSPLIQVVSFTAITHCSDWELVRQFFRRVNSHANIQIWFSKVK